MQAVVVLHTAVVPEATREILALHSIPSAVSKDLADVLSASDGLSKAAPSNVQEGARDTEMAHA